MDQVNQKSQISLINWIFDCLVAAVKTKKAAKITLDAFLQLPDDGGLGPAMVERFGKAWGLSGDQARVLGEWPNEQLQLMRTAVIQAARLRLAGVDVGVRVRGLRGRPPSVSVSIGSPGTIDILFISPETA